MFIKWQLWVASHGLFTLNLHNAVSLTCWHTIFLYEKNEDKWFDIVKQLVCEALGLKPRSVWFQKVYPKQLHYVAQCKLYSISYGINPEKHIFLPL